jgi:hypothetical protein
MQIQDKLPGLDKEERIDWEEIWRMPDGKPIQPNLFAGYEEPPLGSLGIAKTSPLQTCSSPTGCQPIEDLNTRGGLRHDFPNPSE